MIDKYNRGQKWRKEIRELSDEHLFFELQKETWDWREDVRNEVLCRILGRLISFGELTNSQPSTGDDGAKPITSEKERAKASISYPPTSNLLW